jgi:hypothetical protein
LKLSRIAALRDFFIHKKLDSSAILAFSFTVSVIQDAAKTDSMRSIEIRSTDMIFCFCIIFYVFLHV